MIRQAPLSAAEQKECYGLLVRWGAAGFFR